MLTIPIALLWGGYAIGYYGWNRITGGNDKFVSLVWPGKWKLTPRDDGSASTPPPAPAKKFGGRGAKEPHKVNGKSVPPPGGH